MIGQFCRGYRLSKGVRLIDLTLGGQIKTLSAFEMGKSSNVNHLITYIELSQMLGDSDNFMNQLNEAIKNEHK